MAQAPNEKAARLIDVARRANVSRATAARALGGYGLVTQSTRERVMAAAAELNYRVNELARSMRSGRSLTIGVVVADIANSFFNKAIRAIIETASQAGYQILVLNTDDEIERERNAVKVLIEKRVDGLIVVPASQGEYEHLVVESEPEVPVVLLDRRVDSGEIDFVMTDDRAAAGQAIRCLVSAGHTRIGLLVATAAVQGYSQEMPAAVVGTVRDRVDGAKAALAELGLSARPEWYRFSQSRVETARKAAIEILTSPEPPTAILATNEDVALGALGAAAELGIEVGGELSIIAFDDAPWAGVFRPPLSVIRRPVASLGAAAVELLLRKIEDGTYRNSQILEAELVNRQSVAPPPAKR
ncbi:LacI family DNA-binding transcriptional regulator [Ensifer adhaerens]|uniref:LacI family DNA-binding transcriptional regulator n=1 Tax=Ensifer adhaerens TaxID=106592 RepID=UPI00156A06BD|nr:LacI family DNA-binding transcriptional regulator [Ensifer adhaerens]